MKLLLKLGKIFRINDGCPGFNYSATAVAESWTLLSYLAIFMVAGTVSTTDAPRLS